MKADFKVTAWEEGSFDEETRSQRVIVRKEFSGEIEGTSVAQLLTAAESGYVASELFTGAIGGRTGTVVLQHGGIHDGVRATTFGNIVPSSGTGELAGIAGRVELLRHDDGSHTIEMWLD